MRATFSISLLLATFLALTGAVPTPGAQDGIDTAAKVARQVPTDDPAPVGIFSEPFPISEAPPELAHILPVNRSDALVKRDPPSCWNVPGLSDYDVRTIFYGVQGQGNFQLGPRSCRSYTFGTAKTTMCNPYSEGPHSSNAGEWAGMYANILSACWFNNKWQAGAVWAGYFNVGLAHS